MAMLATKQLRDEHEGILIMLGIIDQMVARPEFPIRQFEQAIDFLRVFADRCHHGKEEELLFPALERKGIPRENGPIGVMLAEHQTGRGYILAMGEGLDHYKVDRDYREALTVIQENAEAYTNLLRNHIEKENNGLFSMAEQVLTQQEQKELLAKFDILEVERIGVGRHEQFHHLLEELADIYLKGGLKK